MKKQMAMQIIAIVMFLSGSTAYAGNVGVDLNIHLGDQFLTSKVIERRVINPPQPYVSGLHGYPAVTNVRFIYPEALGFYVAVGVPYDLCYLHDSYYLFRDGCWLRGRSSRGPWVVQSSWELPRELRSQRIERIRDYRHSGQRDNGRYQDRRSGRDFSQDNRRQQISEREPMAGSVEGRAGTMARR